MNMQIGDRDMNGAMEAFIHRTKELQQSILALLNKLDMNDKIEW